MQTRRFIICKRNEDNSAHAQVNIGFYGSGCFRRVTSAAELIKHSCLCFREVNKKRFEPTTAGQSHASCPYSADWEDKDTGFLTLFTQCPQQPHRKNENQISHQDWSRALTSLYITGFDLNVGIWFNVQNKYSGIYQHQWSRPCFHLQFEGLFQINSQWKKIIFHS